VGTVGLMKSVEDRLLLSRFNPDAGVGNREMKHYVILRSHILRLHTDFHKA